MNKSKAFLQKIADEPPPCVTINDPEIFFPTSYGDEYRLWIRNAKEVCRNCPLTFDCLEFALDTDDQFAVLAGTTPAERDVIRRRRNERDQRNTEATEREFETERRRWAA